ncbi:hypothetical protein [Pedobacter steynii]
MLTDGYWVGASHGHPAGMGPSPADAVWLARPMTDTELTGAGSTAVNKYKAMASATVMTTTGSYVITVKDWPKLVTALTNYDSNENAVKLDFQTKGNDYLAANPTKTPQEASVFALLKLYGDVLNVYKADAGSTTYRPLKLDSSNRVADLACP